MRGGIRTVVIPEENRKDLADIPKSVSQQIRIVPVRWIDEVLDIALERPLTPRTVEEAIKETAHAEPEAGAPAPGPGARH
jgi:ATP-dependent Lon protease